jgi:calcineurin-like phosphoesterase family protein
VKFRDDIDPDTTWVVSDTHFGHDNIVGFCHRPEDHEQVMIAEWRAQVPDDATVLHLGDLCYKSNARFKNITAPELTGSRKLLILGNHDRQRFSFYRDCGFRVVKPFAIGVSAAGDGLYVPALARFENGVVPPQTTWIVGFSHYPYTGEQTERYLHIHGHIHNNGYSRDTFVPFIRNHINLSVEQTKYRPVNLGVLLRAHLLGVYPETTEEQLAEARERKTDNREAHHSN